MSSLSRDGLLVVRSHSTFAPDIEQIIVPRPLLHGLLTALHIKLAHPTTYQLKKVFLRGYAALDLDKAVAKTTNSCHTCASLKKLPKHITSFGTSPPADHVGQHLASDVLRRSRQLIFVTRESVSSFTSACFIQSEDSSNLEEGMTCSALPLHNIHGPPSTLRVDPSPGFQTLLKSQPLKHLGITIEQGRFKNINKNPVAEKAIQELEDELLRLDSPGGPITPSQLSIAIARLNARIRLHGLSASEIFTRRNQFTGEQLNNDDSALIKSQHSYRTENHDPSYRSQIPSSYQHCRTYLQQPILLEGSIVYLKNDRSKMASRDMYMIIKKRTNGSY